MLGIVALITFFAARRRLPDIGHRVWVAMVIIVGDVLAKSFGRYSLEASALLGSTLVSVTGDRITEPEMLAYFDALRPVAPDKLEFKRG